MNKSTITIDTPWAEKLGVSRIERDISDDLITVVAQSIADWRYWGFREETLVFSDATTIGAVIVTWRDAADNSISCRLKNLSANPLLVNCRQLLPVPSRYAGAGIVTDADRVAAIARISAHPLAFTAW